jgi:hypothetical protein
VCLQIPREQFPHDRPLGRIDAHACWVTRPFRIDAIAIGRRGPGQEETGTQLHLSSPSHPLGHQRPFIFCHRAADLQHELIMGIVAHGPFQKLHSTAGALQLFQEDHLVHIIPRQTIRRGDQDTIDLGASHGIAETIEPRPI